jgi:hypothetical protein
MRANIGTDERSFMRRFPYRQWFWDDGPIFWKSSEGNFGNHYGIDDASFTMFRGRFVGLFRNPALRAASAYAHFAEAIDAKGTLVSEREYAIRIRGSQTTQLAGQAFGLTCIWLNHNHDGRNHCRYHKPDIVKAIHRLITGFAFVGLTELYDLSVCLFHAMFGGRCLPVEFTNTRPARDQALLPGSFTAWGGMVDGYDWRLYSEATRIFFERLQQYGVNEAKCLALCVAEAQPLDHPTDTQFRHWVLKRQGGPRRDSEQPITNSGSDGRLAGLIGTDNQVNVLIL